VPDEFLTVTEIAELLRVHQQTVRNWLDRGQLEGVRVGSRRVRVRQSALDQFLGAGQRRSAAEPSVATVDERSSTAWATFGAAMAEATTTLERADRTELVRVLDSLATATRDLVDALRAEEPS
jgi:excisionase family DNA binding protein